MNWKAEAIEKLSGYTALRQSVCSIPLELKRLELEAAAIRSPSMNAPAVRSGNSSREDMLLNNIVKRNELLHALEQAKLWVKTTDHALSCLEPKEQQLLEQIYITPQWGNLNQLMLQTGLAKGTLYRKRDEALKKFTIALYGKS